MYENLTVQHFLSGASSEAIQSMLIDGIKELDPYRVGACTEALAQRGLSLQILRSIAKSSPIFLPAASTRCLINCLQQAQGLTRTVSVLTKALAFAFSHVDNRLSKEFSFENDFLCPVQYLCSRQYISLDRDEFDSTYETELKNNPKTPKLSEDGKDIAYFFQITANEHEDLGKQFSNVYDMARLSARE